MHASMSDCESRIWDTGDAPLGLRKPGGLPVYGLPVVATLFMLRMLWVTRRDAVPSYHSYWATHTPSVFMLMLAAVFAGGVALAWRYVRPEWVMGGELALALLLDLAGVGEWAPIMPMIAYWALIMTVSSDLRILCFGLASCMVLGSQAFAGDGWRQAGWSIWLDILPAMLPIVVIGVLGYAVRNRRLSSLALQRERDERLRADLLAQQRDAAVRRGSIVGEMHDSVGHDLTSIIALAQGLAEQVEGQDVDPEVAQAIDAIRDIAKSGLQDTRHALRALTTTDANLPGIPPTTGGTQSHEMNDTAIEESAQRYMWDDIRPVLAHVRASGVIATFTETGRRSEDPDQADLCFRVTREAVTNAVRHAPGLAHLNVTWDHAADGSLIATITNDGSTNLPKPSDGAIGTGLARIADAIARTEGFLCYGPDRAETGVWRVTAMLTSVRQEKGVTWDDEHHAGR